MRSTDPTRRDRTLTPQPSIARAKSAAKGIAGGACPGLAGCGTLNPWTQQTRSAGPSRILGRNHSLERADRERVTPSVREVILERVGNGGRFTVVDAAVDLFVLDAPDPDTVHEIVSHLVAANEMVAPPRSTGRLRSSPGNAGTSSEAAGLAFGSGYGRCEQLRVAALRGRSSAASRCIALAHVYASQW